MGNFPVETLSVHSAESAGGYICDSAGFSSAPETAHNRELGFRHAHLAMLEASDRFTLATSAENGVQFGEPMWSNTGFQIFSKGGLDHLGNPNLFQAQRILGIWACQVILMETVERHRVAGEPVGQVIDSNYPGGSFDPLGIADDPNISMS